MLFMPLPMQGRMVDKIRYNVIVRTSSRGVKKQDVIFNKDPARPRSIKEVFDDVVANQYGHLGFGLRSNKLPKYQVNGIRYHGVGVDDTDVVFMWCPQTKACVVIKVVRV
jgi:hypothetical protein